MPGVRGTGDGCGIVQDAIDEVRHALKPVVVAGQTWCGFVHGPALAWSKEMAKELGIQKPETPQEIDVLGGNLVAETMQPYAACYAGHQFGNWAGQLGDGRAITLGEWLAPTGNNFELQLKGGGPTPYSRRADGRAVL